ncbi:hypothetical protein CXB51_004156 [Gossypium anomalum]|uniref:Integrase catalytic domain-containing protein n=1 Tax=Gossypium anomalum TaxID=47600 RepID=A0A8J5ZE81_9ROSI|nr:hypothetical protein CXB51_004156 [Gossypium anomalum]
MATTHSDDSTSAEPSGSMFTSDRVVTSFPRHEVVKLDESTFIQWQQQVRFILRGYGLLGFLDGTFTALTRFVRSTDGTLIANPSALLFEQQDNLLTSWLLSMISSSFLSSFTDVRTACDVWTMANSIFTADTSTKQLQLRHNLHSLKKGTLSVRAVWCLDTERTVVLLAGLSSDFDVVVSSISLSPDVLISVNLIEGSQSHDVDGSSRGGRPPLHGRGRGFCPRVQCQICSRYGHLAQRCYYRYYRDETSSTKAPMVQQGGPVFGAIKDDWRSGFRSQNRPGQRPGQNWVAYGQNWMPSNVYIRPNVGASNVDPRGPHAATTPLGPNPFVAPGTRPPNDGFHSAYGHQSLAQPYGDIGGQPTRTYGPNGTGQEYGPSGSVRPRLNNGQISSKANVNCVNIDGPLQNTAPVVLWQTKPRARVFDVDSYQYDSSQFVRIPRLPELHASDYSDATAYDPNWDGTGSYVPLPVESTSWCPDTGATYHVCQNASGLNTSTPYSRNSSLLMGNGAPTRISSIGHTVLPTPNKVLHLSNVLCVPIRDGLYQFTVAQSVPPATVPSIHNAEVLSISTNNNVFELWHKRLGHPSDAVIKDVLNKSNVAFTKKCLGSGPASVACGGNLYYVSFIDMCSRFTWGGEFRAFASVLASHGILHRLSYPHTSEQNGVAERKHRHIVETGLTLLAQATLPMMYWGYAFCSAVHLINRLPTPVLQSQSPYQALYGKEPTYDHLRVFGCCCFPYLRPFLSHKLDFQSQPCTFLGYSSQHKGYHCLTPDGKMVISRHMVFDEQRFPFSSAVMDTDSTPRCVPTYVPIVRSSVVQPLVRSVDVSSGGCPSCPGDLVPEVSVSLGNTHPMVTRSKAGVFKPRVLHVETDDFELRTVEEALAHTEWKQAVQAKFDALVTNSTWCLVPLPPGRKETFSPVVKPATIRVILSVAVSKGWKLRQVDFNNAFLNGDLTDKVFMQQSPGFLTSAGFVLSKSDASLFVRITTTSTLYVLVYVDDIIITSNEPGSIDDFVQQLHSKFSLKDMGDLHYFLGVEVTRMPTGSLHLCQRKYIRDVLDRSGLANTKNVNTPMISSSILSKNDGDFLSDPTDYRSLAGALQYIVLTPPDIAYTVNWVCQFMHAPTTGNLIALKRILRYLRGTIDYGLILRPSDPLSLVGYADANWGLDFDDRRSTIGYSEAEYRSLAAAASDVTWLLSLLQELHLCSADVPALWCDNSSTVAVAANPVLYSKFKHVELNLFFVCEKVVAGSLVVGEVPACDQVADVLTKPLSASVFTRFQNFLRVCPAEKMGECLSMRKECRVASKQMSAHLLISPSLDMSLFFVLHTLLQKSFDLNLGAPSHHHRTWWPTTRRMDAMIGRSNRGASGWSSVERADTTWERRSAKGEDPRVDEVAVKDAFMDKEMKKLFLYLYLIETPYS